MYMRTLSLVLRSLLYRCPPRLCYREPGSALPNQFPKLAGLDSLALPAHASRIPDGIRFQSRLGMIEHPILDQKKLTAVFQEVTHSWTRPETTSDQPACRFRKGSRSVRLLLSLVSLLCT
jgi:hypothetical protein